MAATIVRMLRMPRAQIQVVLAAVVVTALIAYVGPAAIWETLNRARWTLVALGFAFYLAFFVARGIRWHRLLRASAPQAGIPSLVSLTAIGWMINSFVPLKAGDAARVAILAKQQRADVSAVAGTVAIERVLDVLGTAIAASLGLLGAGLVASHRFPSILAKALLVAWILPILGAVALLTLGSVARATGSTGRAARIFVGFSAAADELRSSPREWLPLLAATLAVTACQVGVFTALIVALLPNADLALVLAGVPLFLLTFIVAVFPANIGTYEAGFVGVFSVLGLEGGSLLPLAISVHLLTTSFATIIGGAAFASNRLFHHDFVPAPAVGGQDL